ncbi:MAG: pyrroline-5-carboxylate reductase [Clostridia bacterium]|nr:pyrroline-5-carboxylate reductase [Clostridia bacterium]
MLGFIGVGNMASAIITGILNKGLYSEKDIKIYDKDTDKYKKFNLTPSESIKDLCIESDMIFLCVKPQIYTDVLEEISCSVPKELIEKKVFISIAAGISTSFICRKLSVKTAVIRVMPNTPLLIGEGASAICKNEFANDDTFSNVADIFSSLGVCKKLEEDTMNKIIAVNGSSPAYVYLLAKAMCNGALAQGIQDDILPLIIQTIIGSAKMMEQSSLTPDQLIKMVASPNGTTLAALQSFEDDDFCGIVARAMQQCTNRAEEIAEEIENN